MNWEHIEGHWKQFKGNIRARWSRISDDELDRIAGKRERLAGKLQERYGASRDEIERQLRDFAGETGGRHTQ